MLPPITFLGWIHTGCGIAAILIGAYALNKYKVISFSERAAKDIFTTNINYCFDGISHLQSGWL